MRFGILIIVALFLIASCTPPAAMPLDGAGAPQTTKPVEVKPLETTVGGPSSTNQTASPAPVSNIPLQPKTEDCISGRLSCKGTKLLECRKGKLITKEDCEARTCYTDHCGECVPNETKCEGTKLVKCTADARKKVTECFACEDKKCIDAPKTPVPFECAHISNVELSDSTLLDVYSPFKKENVRQELVISNYVENTPKELGKVFANGVFEKTPSQAGKGAIFVNLAKCYVYCILEADLEVTMTCQDTLKTVKFMMPAHSGATSDPIRFFVSEGGSTYFGDSEKSGKGTDLTKEQIYVESQLAVKGQYP